MSGYDILIVDEDKQFSQVAEKYLENESSLNVKTESDPEEALSYIDETKPDCVVSDCQMSKLNGLEFLDEVRSVSHIPFILYTGKPEDIGSKAINKGADDYVQKGSGTDHFRVLARKIKNTIKANENTSKFVFQRTLLDDLNEIFDSNASTRSKIRKLIEFGCRYLDIDVGFVSSISEGDLNIILRSENEKLKKFRDKCSMDKSYCQFTIESQHKPFVIENAEEDGFEDIGAYKDFGIESYIGDEIHVQDSLYGTLCFIDENPKKFDERDRTFVRILTRWVSYEITQKKFGDKMNQQNKYLADFMSLISHDLKNPLSVCLAYTEVLQEDMDREELQKIKDSLDRCVAMIDDFSVLSVAIDGFGEEEIDHFSGRDAVELAWSNMPKELTSKGNLSVDIPNKLSGNMSLVTQIFQNLFVNSIKHNKEPVSINIREDGSKIIVEDDGSGVRSDKIFKKGRSGSKDGTGLGLYIVKRICEAHNWTVDYDENYTEGARFIIETSPPEELI